jgi:hypothetical protein
MANTSLGDINLDRIRVQKGIACYEGCAVITPGGTRGQIESARNINEVLVKLEKRERQTKKQDYYSPESLTYLFVGGLIGRVINREMVYEFPKKDNGRVEVYAV